MYQFLVQLLFMVWGSAMAWSQVLGDKPKLFAPYSETALAITGPVTLSKTRIVFESGAALDLEEINPKAPGSWGNSGDVPVAQMFRVSGKVGALRQGNTLCGEDLVTYLSASHEESFGYQYLVIALFVGADAPKGINDSGLCGIFSYSVGASGQ